MKKTIKFLETVLITLEDLNTSDDSPKKGKLGTDIRDMRNTINYLKSTNIDYPTPCFMQYDEICCRQCEFFNTEYVSHPGGDSLHTVEKNHCEHGFWKDDF